MTDKLKYAEELIRILRKDMKIIVGHIFPQTLYDEEQGDTEIEFKEFGDIRYNPSFDDIQKTIDAFRSEVKNNKYDLLRFEEYIKRCFNAIMRIHEDFDNLIIANQQVYKFKIGMKIYFNGDPDPIIDYSFLNQETLTSIQEYCQSQKETIFELLKYLNEKVSEDLFDSTAEPVIDESDSRIFLKAGPDKVRDYFSFLAKETSKGDSIMNELDFEYFLYKNFQGFPPVTKNRTLSFKYIGTTHFQYIIYNFYTKYSKADNLYNKERWAQLLKNTFPTNFSKNELDSIRKNIKEDKNNSLKYIFEDLRLSLPQ